MAKNHAAILPSPHARLEVVERAIPTPGQEDVLVRIKAVAINPLDWKIQDYNILCPGYPMIIGTDIAGEVVSVGTSVTLFKQGDRVASLAGALNLNDVNYGGFQEYALMRDFNTVKIPDKMSFEEAAVLPTGATTAGLSIFWELGIPKLRNNEKSAGEGEGFLIWGASSAMGIAGIQVAKAAGFSVYVTASSGRHADLKALGADYCFDYKHADVVEDVIAAVKRNGEHINYGFDPIAEGTTSPTVLQILSKTRKGPATVVATLPFPEDGAKPESTEAKMVNALQAPSQEYKDVVGWLFNEWLPKALADGTYKSAPAVQVEGRSVEAIQKAIDTVKKGVSGKKVVVSLE